MACTGGKSLTSYVNAKIHHMMDDDIDYESFVSMVDIVITGTHYYWDWESEYYPILMDGIVQANRWSMPVSDGLYVHVCNRTLDMNNLSSCVDTISSIDGEICVTDLIDNHFSTRQSSIALIFRGTPTYRFDYDCWSRVVTKGRYAGKRIPTRENGTYRYESWIVPTDCKLWGIAYSGLSHRDSNKIERICLSRGINSLHCFDSLYSD